MQIRRALSSDSSFVLGAALRLADFDPPAWRPSEDIVKGEVRTLQAFFAAPPAGSALLIAESEPGGTLGFVYLGRLGPCTTISAIRRKRTATSRCFEDAQAANG